MQTWGFIEEELWRAARMATARIGGPDLTLREVGEKGRAIKFLLRFNGGTRRLLKRDKIKLDPSNKAEYRPGVLVRPGDRYVQVLDAIPASELFEGGGIYRKELVRFRRGCGAPCFHAFGHFIRALFEINPEGRVKTGLADYRGAKGFEDTYHSADIEKGSMMSPLQYSEACDCHHYGVENF